MSIEADEGTTRDKLDGYVHLQLLNDEGPYLVRLPTVDPAYRRAYREIVEGIELALRPE